MDFFQAQSDNRRESAVLLFAFAAVFAVCFSVVYWFAESVASLFASVPTPYPSLIKWGIFSVFTFIVVLGCYRRWSDVAGGGDKLAEHLGASKLNRANAERREKRLLNMVDELSIAGGVKAPTSYVLQTEHSINAFVAGNSKRTVMVVTQGALEHLSEDELRAVVAHEIGHIANNDLSISMKLLIGLGGLKAISEAGYACYAQTHVKNTSSNNITAMFGASSGSDHTNPAAAFMLHIVLGTLLIALGSLFSFFGDVLKSAFSRKRELLADAKAVQFTRDSWSMASALNTLAEKENLRGMRLRFQGEVDHMCIDSPTTHRFFPKFLATHPPLQKRIASIDPHFDVKHRKKKEQAARKNSAGDATTREHHVKQGSARTVVSHDIGFTNESSSIGDCGEELALLFSLVIQTSGYKHEANNAKYLGTLKCYVNEALPMRTADEPGIEEEFEKALRTLLTLPAIQRQNLLDHLAELVDHDGIQLPEETHMLERVYSRLNPSQKAA